MNQEENITRKIKDTLDSANRLESVGAPPFFKDKVLHELYNEREPATPLFIKWFAPSYQLALLIAVLFVNSYVLYASYRSTYQSEIETFAQSYNLSSENESLWTY